MTGLSAPTRVRLAVVLICSPYIALAAFGVGFMPLVTGDTGLAGAVWLTAAVLGLGNAVLERTGTVDRLLDELGVGR
jgi:Mg/Co/Ni transporter MgtE